MGFSFASDALKVLPLNYYRKGGPETFLRLVRGEIEANYFEHQSFLQA